MPSPRLQPASGLLLPPCMQAETPPAILPAPLGHRHLLLQRDFALFFAAISVSTLGTATVPVALTFALLVSGYSASTVGLVLAAQSTATVLLMLLGGAVADRWPRRRLMVGADLLRCTSQTILAVLLLLGHPALSSLLALAACGGVGNAFYGPAESGLIPQVAGRERVKAANSLTGLSGSLSAIVGPALGGLLVGLGSAPIAIGLDAASYACSAACLSLMRVVRQAPTAEASMSANIRMGWSEFRRHRWLRLLTLQYGLLNLFAFAPFFVLGPAMFAHLHAGARIWGLIASATGLGGILGGLLMLRLHVARPLLLIQLATALLALPLVMLALHAAALTLALGSLVFGVALAVVNILVQTTLQQSIPADYLSRVSSLVGLAVMGLTPVGFAVCGPAASLLGTEPALGLSAGAVLLSMVPMLASPEIRSFRSP